MDLTTKKSFLKYLITLIIYSDISHYYYTIYLLNKSTFFLKFNFAEEP